MYSSAWRAGSPATVTTISAEPMNRYETTRATRV
jgi:hypothetical protein